MDRLDHLHDLVVLDESGSTLQAMSLDIFLCDPAGAIVGGILAETCCGWLKIKCLWIDETIRRQGYGKKLLLAAETVALQRMCLFAQATTLGLPSLGFYESLGYRVIGQRDDFLPGSCYFWLRKDLSLQA